MVISVQALSALLLSLRQRARCAVSMHHTQRSEHRMPPPRFPLQPTYSLS